jgi:hypothetical protein
VAILAIRLLDLHGRIDEVDNGVLAMRPGAPDMVSRERMWRLVSISSGLLGGLLARRLIRVAYQIVRKDTAPVTPFDPTNPQFSWPDAVLWAAAAGIGLGVAKVVSARLAAVGWEAATGTLPPGAAEERADD